MQETVDHYNGLERWLEFDNFNIETKLGHTINNADDTLADCYHKNMLKRIFLEGCLDHNPRPHYSDGVPAHTISVNGAMHQYDLSKSQLPIITLRPIAVKSAIGEMLWIYQDQSNDLDLLKEKYNVTWWDEWDIGNRTIGQVYGATVKRYNLIDNLLKDLKENPDGRRHIMSLWQENDFKEPHGLKPCAFMTIWNVRHAEDTDYLDMTLVIRSSDYPVASTINQMQYVVLQHIIARDCGYTPGLFTFFMQNVQIYDRHISNCIELCSRSGVPCMPKIWLNPDKKNFYNFTIDDIKVVDYPREEIKKKNPQLKFDLGI